MINPHLASADRRMMTESMRAFIASSIELERNAMKERNDRRLHGAAGVRMEDTTDLPQPIDAHKEASWHPEIVPSSSEMEKTIGRQD